jgi:hypothetical protein
MSRTCGHRDIISLVIPRIGDNMTIQEKEKTHTKNQQRFYLEALQKGLQMKQHILEVAKVSFLGPQILPYLVSSSLRNQQVFLGCLILSHPSGRNDFVSEDEYESSSTYGIPLQKWIDEAFGYTFKQDDQVDGFSFQQDFLPPTHIHEFHFMTDYMCIYNQDYYVFELYFLYYMINHMGKYFDETISWFH